MSRYELTINPPNTLAIGWDRPMNTYFLQLQKESVENPDADPEMVIWIGGDFDECQNVDHILDVASRYSADAAGYRDRLVADRAAGR